MSNWHLNMVGPPWFRRLRTAIRWYRSGRPMIEVQDLEIMLASDEPLKWFEALVHVHKMLEKAK